MLDQAPLRRLPAGASVEEAIALLNIHTGVPEDVIASLQADTALARATDWSVQVHSIDPPHPYIPLDGGARDRSFPAKEDVNSGSEGW